MDNRSTIENVLRELHARGIRCGLVRLGDGVIGAWVDDGAFVEENRFVGDAPEMLDEMARWLKKTVGEQALTLPDNVIDARRRFTRR